MVEYLFSPGWSAGGGVATSTEYHGILAGSRERLVLVDQPSGDLIAIVVQTNDPTRFDAFAASATSILQSLRFPVSFPGG